MLNPVLLLGHFCSIPRDRFQLSPGIIYRGLRVSASGIRSRVNIVYKRVVGVQIGAGSLSGRLRLECQFRWRAWGSSGSSVRGHGCPEDVSEVFDPGTIASGEGEGVEDSEVIRAGSFPHPAKNNETLAKRAIRTVFIRHY